MTSTARKPQKLLRGVSELRPGTYRVRVSHEGRQLLLGTYTTIGDARAARDIARGEIARGIFVPPAKRREALKEAERRAAREAARAAYSVDDLAAEWLVFLERSGRTVSTVYSYRKRYERHIQPVLGTVAVAEVTPDDVAAWYESLDERHGNGVARPCYQTLSSMFTYARGRAKGQPRSFIPKVTDTPCRLAGADDHKPVRKVVRQTATPEEVSEISARMPQREQLAVLLGAWAGLRMGEVLALRRRDVRSVVGENRGPHVHRRGATGSAALHRQRPGLGFPVEEAAGDVLHRDRPRVVIGLVSLVLGAVVPRRSPSVGESDQAVQVQCLQCLARHFCSFLACYLRGIASALLRA